MAISRRADPPDDRTAGRPAPYRQVTAALLLTRAPGGEAPKGIFRLIRQQVSSGAPRRILDERLLGRGIANLTVLPAAEICGKGHCHGDLGTPLEFERTSSNGAFGAPVHTREA